jgi:hypothetical protein
MRGLVLFAALSMLPRPSEACKYPSYPGHELDLAHADDLVAPPAPIVTYRVDRVEGDPGSSCDTDFGLIGVTVSAMDDRTPERRLGLIATPVPGTDLPQYFRLLFGTTGDTRYGIESPGLTYAFDYEAEVIDFELDVQVVDLNGNFSAPTRVHVVHDASGCTAGTSSTGWATALCALAFVLRPRRSRARLRQCRKHRSS